MNSKSKRSDLGLFLNRFRALGLERFDGSGTTRAKVLVRSSYQYAGRIRRRPR